MARLQQYCTFHVGDLLLGIEVLQVQEVIRFHEITGVPLAPRLVRGLINLRGQIVMAVDLRERLGLPPLPGGLQPLNIVIRTSDGPVSLLADEIGDVLELDPSILEAPPETVPPIIKELVIGIHKYQDNLILIVDPERIIQANEAVARIA